MFKKLLHRPAALVLHLALLLVVVGAVVTSLSSRKGMLHLRVGESSASYIENKKGELPMPFVLRLDDFAVSYYPGTDTPADYRSTVSVLADGEVVRTADVSMNHILSYRGYRFYQTTYDSDSLGSTLTVSRDPWGTGLVYAGYAAFLLAFLLFFFTDRKFRALVRKVSGTAAVAAVLLGGLGDVLLCRRTKCSGLYF